MYLQSLFISLALSRSRPSIYLPSIMILWGALTCIMAAVKNFAQLVALRTILGCIEAGFAPGVILLLSSWYKQTEQSKRFGVFISAAVLSGAFGGLIAAGIVEGLEGAHGIRGWRWLFIIEGVITVGFAILSIFILPDFPTTTRRLSDRERQIAVARLASQNAATTTERLSNLNACKVACKDLRTWAFVIGYMVRRCSLSLYFKLFLPFVSGTCRFHKYTEVYLLLSRISCSIHSI